MITRHEYVNTVKWLDIYRQAECNFGGRSQESNLPGTAGGPNWI